MPVEDVDDLFEVPPAEFVRARDELAKRLHTEGRADEARDVKQLRRPSVVVWALNQVARHRPKEVERLLEAGDAVRKAQQSRAGARLREAGNALQAEVSRVATEAAELLGRAPRVHEVEAALRSAALGGAGSADELRQGRLREVPAAPTGMEMWTAGTEDDAEPEPDQGPDPSAKRLQEARSSHRKAETDAERARGRVERSEARVKELSARLADERAALDEARADLRDAERRVREAAREVARQS